MKFLKTCCDFSKSQLEYYCDQHGFRCPDIVLTWRAKDGEIPERFLLLAENATYIAKFCPYCGKNLKETCIPDRESEE